ncbi:hypothetical protein Nmel_017200, partial [Mimus melanotis]
CSKQPLPRGSAAGICPPCSPCSAPCLGQEGQAENGIYLHARGKGKEIPPARPRQDGVGSGVVLQPGPCWAGRWSRTQGERGTDFLLTCLGLLGHLPLARSLLLLHGAKGWEWEILVWEKQGMSA